MTRMELVRRYGLFTGGLFLEGLGIELDQHVNDLVFGTDSVISTPESKVKVAVICTDEELLIAQDTMKLINEAEKQ